MESDAQEVSQLASQATPEQQFDENFMVDFYSNAEECYQLSPALMAYLLDDTPPITDPVAEAGKGERSRKDDGVTGSKADGGSRHARGDGSASREKKSQSAASSGGATPRSTLSSTVASTSGSASVKAATKQTSRTTSKPTQRPASTPTPSSTPARARSPRPSHGNSSAGRAQTTREKLQATLRARQAKLLEEQARLEAGLRELEPDQDVEPSADMTAVTVGMHVASITDPTPTSIALSTDIPTLPTLDSAADIDTTLLAAATPTARAEEIFVGHDGAYVLRAGVLQPLEVAPLPTSTSALSTVNVSSMAPCPVVISPSKQEHQARPTLREGAAVGVVRRSNTGRTEDAPPNPSHAIYYVVWERRPEVEPSEGESEFLKVYDACEHMPEFVARRLGIRTAAQMLEEYSRYEAATLFYPRIDGYADFCDWLQAVDGDPIERHKQRSFFNPPVQIGEGAISTITGLRTVRHQRHALDPQAYALMLLYYNRVEERCDQRKNKKSCFSCVVTVDNRAWACAVTKALKNPGKTLQAWQQALTERQLPVPNQLEANIDRIQERMGKVARHLYAETSKDPVVHMRYAPISAHDGRQVAIALKTCLQDKAPALAVAMAPPVSQQGAAEESDNEDDSSSRLSYPAPVAMMTTTATATMSQDPTLQESILSPRRAASSVTTVQTSQAPGPSHSFSCTAYDDDAITLADSESEEPSRRKTRSKSKLQLKRPQPQQVVDLTSEEDEEAWLNRMHSPKRTVKVKADIHVPAYMMKKRSTASGTATQPIVIAATATATTHATVVTSRRAVMVASTTLGVTLTRAISSTVAAVIARSSKAPAGRGVATVSVSPAVTTPIASASVLATCATSAKLSVRLVDINASRTSSPTASMTPSGRVTPRVASTAHSVVTRSTTPVRTSTTCGTTTATPVPLCLASPPATLAPTATSTPVRPLDAAANASITLTPDQLHRLVQGVRQGNIAAADAVLQGARATAIIAGTDTFITSSSDADTSTRTTVTTAVSALPARPTLPTARAIKPTAAIAAVPATGQAATAPPQPRHVSVHGVPRFRSATQARERAAGAAGLTVTTALPQQHAAWRAATRPDSTAATSSGTVMSTSTPAPEVTVTHTVPAPVPTNEATVEVQTTHDTSRALDSADEAALLASDSEARSYSRTSRAYSPLSPPLLSEEDDDVMPPSLPPTLTPAVAAAPVSAAPASSSVHYLHDTVTGITLPVSNASEFPAASPGPAAVSATPATTPPAVPVIPDTDNDTGTEDSDGGPSTGYMSFADEDVFTQERDATKRPRQDESSSEDDPDAKRLRATLPSTGRVVATQPAPAAPLPSQPAPSAPLPPQPAPAQATPPANAPTDRRLDALATACELLPPEVAVHVMENAMRAMTQHERGQPLAEPAEQPLENRSMAQTLAEREAKRKREGNRILNRPAAGPLTAEDLVFERHSPPSLATLCLQIAQRNLLNATARNIQRYRELREEAATARAAIVDNLVAQREMHEAYDTFQDRYNRANNEQVRAHNASLALDGSVYAVERQLDEFARFAIEPYNTMAATTGTPELDYDETNARYRKEDDSDDPADASDTD